MSKEKKIHKSQQQLNFNRQQNFYLFVLKGQQRTRKKNGDKEQTQDIL